MDSDMFAEPVRGASTQRRETSTPGSRLPMEHPSTQGGARRRTSEKLQGPRGPDGARTRHSVAVERTSIDDWIDDDGEEMDLEHGDQVPQSPGYEPTSPRGGESEADMDIGPLGLLKTCSGREDVKQRVSRDAEVLKVVRCVGGSVSACTREEQCNGGHCV